jgi:hypothetical protein
MITVIKKKFHLKYYLYINSKGVVQSNTFKIIRYSNFLGSKKPFFFCHKKQKTILIDLEEEKDVLWKNIKNNTRNEIRRGLNGGLIFYTDVNINEFVDFYNRFAIEKGLAILTIDDCKKYGNNLYITGVLVDGKFSVMHAYICDIDESIVTLLYSASLRMNSDVDSKMIGICNRFSHYQDMLYFKNEGFKLYDWGGIYDGNKDQSQIGIAKFKKSFGGEIKTTDVFYSLGYYFLSILR